MAHSFSAASLKDMENIFDSHIAVLLKRLDRFGESGETFDLKEAISFFTYDMIGELAFGTNFESQKAADPANLPPIPDHVLLACMIGIMSNLLPYSKSVVAWLPFSWSRRLVDGRVKLREQAVSCVDAAMGKEDGNKNLLTHLIQARDADTGASLTKADISSEAFGFLLVPCQGKLYRFKNSKLTLI
jgi:cytochrome P450